LRKRIPFSAYPKVVSRENCIIICFEDGTELFWGEENSTIEALDLARELEIELRAVSFLKTSIIDFMAEMTELLFAIGADEGLISSIIEDGHNQAYKELEYKNARNLVMDSKPELKATILKKTQQYIS
jgi:hypothetical protein